MCVCVAWIQGLYLSVCVAYVRMRDSHETHAPRLARDNSNVPEVAVLSVAEFRRSAAVALLGTNGTVSSHPVTLDTVSSFAT